MKTETPEVNFTAQQIYKGFRAEFGNHFRTSNLDSESSLTTRWTLKKCRIFTMLYFLRLLAFSFYFARLHWLYSPLWGELIDSIRERTWFWLKTQAFGISSLSLSSLSLYSINVYEFLDETPFTRYCTRESNFISFPANYSLINIRQVDVTTLILFHNNLGWEKHFVN